LPERTARLDVSVRGIRKVGMIPNVKEIGGKSQILSFSQFEVLD
jgi:hypothetical protein